MVGGGWGVCGGGDANGCVWGGVWVGVCVCVVRCSNVMCSMFWKSW